MKKKVRPISSQRSRYSLSKKRKKDKKMKHNSSVSNNYFIQNFNIGSLKNRISANIAPNSTMFKELRKKLIEKKRTERQEQNKREEASRTKRLDRQHGSFLSGRRVEEKRKRRKRTDKRHKRSLSYNTKKGKERRIEVDKISEILEKKMKKSGRLSYSKKVKSKRSGSFSINFNQFFSKNERGKPKSKKNFLVKNSLDQKLAGIHNVKSNSAILKNISMVQSGRRWRKDMSMNLKKRLILSGNKRQGSMQHGMVYKKEGKGINTFRKTTGFKKQNHAKGKRSNSFDQNALRNNFARLQKKSRVNKSLELHKKPRGLRQHSSSRVREKNQDLAQEELVKAYTVRTRGGKNGNVDKINQDAFLTGLNLEGKSNNHIFGVYDGHGNQGHFVSNFISSNFAGIFKKALKDSKIKGPKEALHQTYKTLFEDLIRSEIDITFSGSTAVTCFIQGQRIYVANSGDSRAIIGSRVSSSSWFVKELSRDHKPELKEEWARIRAKGGRVAACLDMYGRPSGPKRVWLMDDCIPGLAMSRSIGDLVAASVGVTWKPDVKKFSIAPEDQFLLVASDGIWEFMSNLDVLKIVRNYKEKGDLEGACDRLMQEALIRWDREEEGGVDDITFVLVFFN